MTRRSPLFQSATVINLTRAGRVRRLPRRYREVMSPRSERITNATSQVADRIGESVRDTIDDVKPRLRGWMHAASAPLTLAAGIVLVVLSPTASTRVGSAVFASSALVLFSVSAVYHRGTWSPRASRFLRRFDHANIFLLIAGSYTPFTLLLLHGSDRIVLLSVVWTGAILGVLFRVFWTDAPRWLYVPIYVALGWSAVFFFPQFVHHSSTAVLVLI